MAVIRPSGNLFSGEVGRCPLNILGWIQLSLKIMLDARERSAKRREPDVSDVTAPFLLY